MPPDRPETADGYRPEWVEMVRSGCLHLVSVLGDVAEDDLTIVGGLVPGLLIPQEALPAGVDPHPGTMDLDIALAVGILDAGRYREVSRRLREAGFEMDTNDAGNPTRQRWKARGADGEVVVDFLIAPSGDDEPGGLRHLEEDFAAIITPGLDLAFRDRRRITMRGRTIHGAACERRVWVCGPGAFVVLKALAFDNRGRNKDAYDLYYVIRNFGEDVTDVAVRLATLLDAVESRRALAILERDFSEGDAIGPHRAAGFVTDADDAALRQDIAGFVVRLVELCRQAAGEP